MVAGSASFPRQARLTRPAEFQRVFRNARIRSSDAAVTMLAVPNGLGYARLGLAVSRKAVRAAAGRNRVKRIIRESFRRNRQAVGALDIVVIGRPGVATTTNAALFHVLARHWSHLNPSCRKS